MITNDVSLLRPICLRTADGDFFVPLYFLKESLPDFMNAIMFFDEYTIYLESHTIIDIRCVICDSIAESIEQLMLADYLMKPVHIVDWDLDIDETIEYFTVLSHQRSFRTAICKHAAELFADVVRFGKFRVYKASPETAEWMLSAADSTRCIGLFFSIITGDPVYALKRRYIAGLWPVYGSLYDIIEENFPELCQCIYRI